MRLTNCDILRISRENINIKLIEKKAEIDAIEELEFDSVLNFKKEIIIKQMTALLTEWENLTKQIDEITENFGKLPV